MRNERENECVLYYKPQDSICDVHPELKSDDFVLILMNKAQADMLEKFGADCICVDGTHSLLNSNNFEMHTLMVIDDMRQGFPCAFLISNRSDETMLKIFFSFVKRQTKNITPSVFMSGMAEAYLNAWLNIMGAPSHRLFCSWRTNLTKIKTKDKRETVYEHLRVILQETDVAVFDILLNNFCQEVAADPDTIEFANYFTQNYIQNAKCWAYCHRRDLGINTDMHLERMHYTIEYIYLKGKTVERLDKVLHALMKFIRDKLFDRIVLLNKCKVTNKLKEIRSRHKTSKSLDVQIFETDKGWDVPPTSKGNFDVYHIEEVNPNCSCQLICSECNGVCIHRYTCSCIDASIMWNMCKHVHLLCRYLLQKVLVVDKPQGPVLSPDSPSCPNLIMDTTISNKKFKTENILTEVINPKTDSSVFEQQKQELIATLVHKIQNINSLSKLDLVKRLVAAIFPTLKAAGQINNAMFPKVSNATPDVNKKIQAQRRLFSTKRKTKCSKTVFRKPTSQEAQSVAMALLTAPTNTTTNADN